MLFGEIVHANSPCLRAEAGAPECCWIICFRPPDSDIQAVVQGAMNRNSRGRERLVHILPFFIIGGRRQDRQALPGGGDTEMGGIDRNIGLHLTELNGIPSVQPCE